MWGQPQVPVHVHVHRSGKAFNMREMVDCTSFGKPLLLEWRMVEVWLEPFAW